MNHTNKDKDKEDREGIYCATVPISLSDGQKKELVGLLEAQDGLHDEMMDQNLALLNELEGQDENSNDNSQSCAKNASSVSSEVACHGGDEASVDEVSMCRHFEDRVNTMLLTSEEKVCLGIDLIVI